MVRKCKLEISKTGKGYYRVYKNNGKIATPFSPREFSSIGDARKWLKSKKTRLRKIYEVENA